MLEFTRTVPIVTQPSWRSLPWAPKRNLLDVVSKAQDEKRNQDDLEDAKTRRRRLYKIVSEEKPSFPVQKRNFHSVIMENKEIIKMFSMLSACTQELRQVREINKHNYYSVAIIILITLLRIESSPSSRIWQTSWSAGSRIISSGKMKRVCASYCRYH